VPSDDLRILHWNIHSWRDPSGNANVVAVAALISETAPDIVSLAEVDEAWGAPGLLRDLAARCGYSWVFVPAFEFGRDRPDGGFGNALLTRLPILAVQQWQLLWPPRLYDGSEPSEARSVLLARLEQATPFWAGITHLPRKDSQARSDALRRLAMLTDGLTEPWLICGDFNTSASSWLGGNQVAAVSPAKLTYPADEPAEPIDYCVASPGFRLNAEVLPGVASDHLPLLISARQTG
jgi:endonuclease/exonuclease/phosphatase family metal-dependent hydrolase